MNILLAILLLAQPAAASAAPGSFELHAESSPNAPNAKAWAMQGPGGTAETVYLDSEVLLDARAIATAEAVPGPGGMAQIRLGLTAEGAARLAEVTGRLVGRRLGVVAGGRLRSMPYLRDRITGNALVISGNMTEAEAKELASQLGPPPPAPTPVPPGTAIRELQGRWRIVEARMNDRPLVDPKITASAWFFRGGDLLLTNGEGQTERVVVRAEAPGVVRLEGAAVTASPAGAWFVWKREKDDLVIAFNDNFEGKPDGFVQGPKKIVARLRAPGPR